MPFDDKFPRAYQVVSESDGSAIERRLDGPRTELATLAEEIHRVKALLKELKAQHVYLEVHIQQSRAYITPSPVRNLPNELLAEIFSFACDSFEPARYKTPLSISLVCSKWRDISKETQSLWTNIYVSLDPDIIDLFDFYLTRSGDLPISIKVDIEGAFPHFEDFQDDTTLYEAAYTRYRDALGLIFRTFPWWKHAELRINPDDFELLEVTDETSCPLESITIELKRTTVISDPDCWPIFKHISSLRSATICEGQDALSWAASSLPWHQIRHFYTNTDSATELKDFAASRALRDTESNLTLTGHYVNITTFGTLPSLTLLYWSVWRQPSRARKTVRAGNGGHLTPYVA